MVLFSSVTSYVYIKVQQSTKLNTFNYPETNARERLLLFCDGVGIAGLGTGGRGDFSFQFSVWFTIDFVVGVAVMHLLLLHRRQFLAAVCCMGRLWAKQGAGAVCLIVSIICSETCLLYISCSIPGVSHITVVARTVYRSIKRSCTWGMFHTKTDLICLGWPHPTV